MKGCCIVLFLLLTIGFSAQIPEEGLVMYYPMNGNVEDESSNGYHATAQGATFTQDRLGENDQALQLDETDQLIIPAQDFTPFSGDFSITIWFKTPKQTRSHLIELGYWQGGDGEGGNFQITLLSGGTVWAYWNGLGENAMISQQVVHVNDNKWHHLVITRLEDQMHLYIDKQFVPMMSWSTISFADDIGDDEPIIIGGTENPFRGVVDDIAIYQIGLEAQDVEQLFHDRQPLIVTSPTITDRYPKETMCRFEWKCESSIQSIDLTYSLDGGVSWFDVASDVNATLQHYEWQLQDWEPGTAIQVRISDANDALTMVEIGPFYISEYHWEEVNTNCSWMPRDGAGLLVFQDKMWLLGGWNPFLESWLPGYTTNEVWNSVDGENWNFVGNAPWPARHTAGWLVHDDMLWIIGGDWNSGVQQMDVWNSADGINWNEVLDTLPMDVRMTHMVASLGDDMIYFGGQTLTFLDFIGGEVYNDVWSSDDGVGWTELTNNAGWHPRGQIQGHFVRNDTLWLIGGGTYDARHMYSDVWNTTDGVNWNMVTEAADFTPRQYHEVGVFDNRLWVLGGYEGIGNRNDVWYSDNGKDWFELKNTPWPPRHAGGVCTYDSSLWMISGNLWNDSWRLSKEQIPSRLQELEGSSWVQVFPNPADEKFIVQAPIGSVLQLFDLSGRLVYSFIQYNLNEQLDTAGLSQGLYVLKADGLGEVKVVICR